MSHYLYMKWKFNCFFYFIHYFKRNTDNFINKKMNISLIMVYEFDLFISSIIDCFWKLWMAYISHWIMVKEHGIDQVWKEKREKN